MNQTSFDDILMLSSIMQAMVQDLWCQAPLQKQGFVIFDGMLHNVSNDLMSLLRSQMQAIFS